MHHEDWKPFLKLWSEEWLSVHSPEEDGSVDEEVVRDRWLGFRPATEEQVARAETRLGRTLPPSFREFLLVTNGWRYAGEFIYLLAGTDGLDWLKDTGDGHWIDIYRELAEGEAAEEEGEGEGEGEGEKEEEEDLEDMTAAREHAVLARSLRLSLEGDAAVLLLDPEDVDENGEWAAYWLSSWSGTGPERHGSFRELMYDQYASFHSLRHPAGSTSEQWEARIEEARSAALAGAVDGPLKELDEAARFGRGRAVVLQFQLLAMLGNRHTVSLDQVTRSVIGERTVLEHPPLAAEFLPLLFAEERGRVPHAWSTLQHLAGTAPEPVRQAIRDYELRLGTPGFRHCYGNPEFDTAAHDLLERLTAEPVFQVPNPWEQRQGSWSGPGESPYEAYERAQAKKQRLYEQWWPRLRAVLALWRPLSEHHLAPVSVFADPVLAAMLTPERGREFLAMRRG